MMNLPPNGAQFFPYRVNSFSEGKKTIFKRDASPENIYISFP